MAQKLAPSNWNIPNALTVGRIVLTPLVCSALLAGEHQAAAGLFFTAGALDFLDGWAARALKQTSVLGSFLDPLADKVLISSSFVCCGMTGLLPLWAIVPALTRDALLLGGGLYFRWASKPKDVGFFDFADASSPAMEPTDVSKANTALQLGAVASAIASAATGLPGDAVTLAIAGSMTGTTLWSTWEYYRDWGSVAKLQARTAAWQAKQAPPGGVEGGGTSGGEQDMQKDAQPPRDR